MLAIRRTYDIVTPASAEIGDYARCGWTDSLGNEWGSRLEDAPEPEQITFRDLVDLLAWTEPSCCPLGDGDLSDVWCSDTEPEQDRAYFEQGKEKRTSYHFAGDERGKRWWSKAVRAAMARNGARWTRRHNHETEHQYT